MTPNPFNDTAQRLLLYLSSHETFRRAFASPDSTAATHECTRIISDFLRKDFWPASNGAKETPDGANSIMAPVANGEPSYFVRVNHETSGPFPKSEIEEWKKRGLLSDHAQVAQEGAWEWTSIDQSNV
jgi:hypothetical protein